MAGVSRQDQPFETIEADFGFGPVTIYYRRVNIRERRLIRAAHEKSVDDFYVENLFLRSRGENQMRLWKSTAEREDIELNFDPDEVDRVVNLMYAKADTAGN